MNIKQNRGANTAIYIYIYVPFFLSGLHPNSEKQQNRGWFFLVWQQGGLGELFCTQPGNA